MEKKNISLGVNIHSICSVLLVLSLLLPYTSAQSDNDDTDPSHYTGLIVTVLGSVFILFLITLGFVIWETFKDDIRFRRRLDSKIFKTFPVTVYSDVQNKEETLSCVLCGKDFEDGDVFRLLPCNHRFHDCADRWLVSTSTCPLCRFDLKSTVPKTAPNASDIVIEVLKDGQDHTQMATEMISEIQDEW
ncbi:hypothetical protein MKW94_011405 [Papaver nudicaule]|uniref:RING-type domain-containing protein n=1 Tax=Papaver nudicaule TaxID=74823 RepID=A0AA41VWY5_PAPNU|nr:hypothetical protein [Papaver nudicaule]